LTTLTSFFKGNDTKFGIFYPTDYLVALFPGMAAAQKAERALGLDGFSEEDLIAVPGDEVIRFYQEHLEHTGLGQLLMQQLSRMFATEAVYTDHDLKLAEKGAAFLAVYAPNAPCLKEAWDILRPFNPIAARHYALDGVDHLAGEV
jgi:hypothetical protein